MTDFVLVFREGVADVRVRHDRHVMGLFATAEWSRLLAEVGFAGSSVEDPEGRVVFVGRRPTSAV